jgi:antitoxin (DNA-binding transcriptional repressor) of toxin-antitoxin stability system
LHEARSTLPRLIRTATEGTPTPLARGTHHALLTAPAHASALGFDLTHAAVYGIADARKKLGDLIHLASQGRPQVLRRHTTPVAVLLPATADGTAFPAAESSAAVHGQQDAAAAAEPDDRSPRLPGTTRQPPDAPGPEKTDTGTAPTVPTGRVAGTPPQPGTTDTIAPPAPAPWGNGVDAPDVRHSPAAPGTPIPPVTPVALRASHRLAPLGQALDSVLTPTIANAPYSETDAQAGLPTGIRTLDDALGGLQPGRFYLVAAAPGAGSSLIATAAARTTALDHHLPVLYAASGLTRADVAARIVAAHLPVDYRRLRSGRLNPTEQHDVTAFQAELAAAPLFIDDGTDLTTGVIAESVPDLPGLALVVVDRLQVADDPRLPLSGSRLTDAAQALAHLARTHHLPVLATLDTDDPRWLAALGLDVTLTLTRDTDQAHLTLTERDLGPQAHLTLHADLAHARLTDPIDPYAGVPTPAREQLQPSAHTPDTPQHHDNPRAQPAPEAPLRSTGKSSRAADSGYAGRDYSYFTGMITRAVDQALQEHGGDIEATTAALVKKAVPDAMTLFEATRVGANYEHTVYPEMLEFLRKKTKDGADDIWEGRHNWNNTRLLEQMHDGVLPPATVDVLDTNAAFLSAFKTYLPIGTLVHDPNGGFDPKRSGIYRLDHRPVWEHPDLPDPIGNRREEGPVLLTDATIRLLIRCTRYGLCETPTIAECWTSGTSEGLLEKFRRVLTETREAALAREAGGYADGTVTVEYVKAMYSKFTSTLGESNANLEIRRPEWMHTIRSQAFANLWYKAYKAHQNGLVVVRARGTDELHITGGEWRKVPDRNGGVFEEGRMTTQMKLKDQYTLPRKTR